MWRKSVASGRYVVALRRAGLTAALTLGFALFLTASPSAVSVADAQATCTATDQASLATCITMYNAATTGTTVSIAMTADITLASDLPTIDNAASPAAVLVLDGGGHTLDGDEVTREVLSQDAGDLRMSNLAVTGAPSGRAGFEISGGSALIVASTFYLNGASGISTGAELLVLRDSTVALNSGVGVLIFAGELQVERSSIFTNGLNGILRFGDGTVSLQGSLIVDNSDDECVVPGLSNLAGNVVDDDSCGDIGATPSFFSPPGGLPQLLAFDSCSPCTPVATLRAGSKAIDRNTACGPGLVDQRGTARTAGKCDAGSFEIGDCASDVVASTEEELRFAVGCYFNLAAGETISLTLANDIPLDSLLWFRNEAMPPPSFVIDGAGHTLSFTSFAAFGLRLFSGHLRFSNITVEADDAAAIRIEGGSATIDGSTMSGRIGLWVESPHQTIVRNSTIANSDRFGILVDGGGAVRVEQSSIVGNGMGGIQVADGAAALTGSLVADNTDDECTGTGFVDLGGNAFEDSTCGGPATPNLAGSFAGLFDNGCVTAPCTKTVALIAGSPAIDAYTGCGAGLFDQRGVPRTAGKCDAGSFEFPEVVSLCNGLTVTINMQLGALGIGTAGGDVILGTAGDDVIDAGDGNDTVCAGDGDDEVLGGDGNDMLFGEAGADLMRGGPGNDTLEGADGDDRILGGIGEDIMRGGPGNDYLGGFGGDDMIFGDAGNETIFGGFGADTINGGPGNDTIRGLIGNDTINGDDGNDTLDGDRGNDIINGGPGDDVIGGGNANDILNGNAGNDSVSGGRADDTLSGGPDTDTCVGNKHINGDTADSTCETIFGVP